MLSNELGDERLKRALDPTAIVHCGPRADTASAVKLVRPDLRRRAAQAFA
jgi:hypothetical protein